MGSPLQIKEMYWLKRRKSSKDPYEKSVYGVGYLGEGDYVPRVTKGEHTPQYESWIRMLERCYSEKYKSKYPTYKNCYVCDEWHNFQNYAKWYDENHYRVDNRKIQLDKDILIKGNKIYSPETCVFVPDFINMLFTKSNKIRGQYPIGVYLHKKDNKFYAQCNNMLLNKYVYLGSYNTPEEAFNVYKKYKEDLIKEIANIYKDKIPLKLYKAMMKYQVEITD